MVRLQELFRPAIAVMAIPLAHAAYLQGTAIAVGIAGGAALVPVYTALRTISRIAVQMLTALAFPVMPEFAAAHARKEYALSARLAGALAIACATIGLLMAIVVAGAGGIILEIWTKGIIEAPREMILILGACVFLQAIWAPLSDLLLALNRHEAYSYAYLVLAAITVCVTVPLVQTYGIT